MKFQTDFDKRIKDVYDIIALPYPPKTINSDAGALEEEFPEEETTVELKPFKQKTQSYNIHNETLTCRKATKTLSSFITECERKRRENEDKNVKGRDYLKQKEDVIHFINVLSEKAKVISLALYIFDHSMLWLIPILLKNSPLYFKFTLLKVVNQL